MVDKTFKHSYTNEYLKRSWNSCSTELYNELIRQGESPPISNVVLSQFRSGYEYKPEVLWSTKPLANSRLVWKDVKADSLYLSKMIKQGKDWTTWIPDGKNKTLNMEFIIFREKFKAYREYLFAMNYPELYNPIEFITEMLEKGPVFNDSLKKTFDYSVRELMAESNVNTPEDVKTFLMKDINNLFPARHCIPFEFERDISDAKLSFEKAKYQMSDNNRLRLKSELKKHLKPFDGLRDLDTLDSIKLGNLKKTLSTSHKKGVASNIRLNEGYPDILATDHLYYQVSFTSKSAEESRVVAIADLPTRNLTHIVREMTSQMVNNPYDWYGKSRWSIESFLKCHPNRYFLMADQKKSGWTFPTELITLFFEVVKEEYPGYKPFELIHDIFLKKRIFLEVDGLVQPIERGFVLGMWDHIMSYVISCLFTIFKEDMLIKFSDMSEKDIEAKFWGDDQVIRINNSTLDRSYQIYNRWMAKMLSHGLHLSNKKSFLGQKAVFCEVYTPDSDIYLIKELIYILMPFDALRGINQTQCKYLWAVFEDYINSVFPYMPLHRDELFIEKCNITLSKSMSMIGWEFDYRECDLPLETGGWHISRDEVGDLSLLQLVWDDKIPNSFRKVALVKEPSNFSRASKEVKENLKCGFVKTIFKKFKVPFNIVLKTNIEDMINNINEKFSPWTKTSKWNKFYQRRREAFLKDDYVSSTRLFAHLFSEKKFKNSLPPPHIMVRRHDAGNWSFEQEPHTSKIKMTPERAWSLIRELGGDDILIPKYFFREYISFKDIVSELAPAISHSKYSIPTDWYAWCLWMDMDINTIYSAFKKNFLEDLFDYHPPFCYKLEEFMSDQGLKPDTIIYWDNNYGYWFQLTPYETTIASDGGPSRDALMASKLDITVEEYLLKCEIRGMDKRPEPEDIFEEIDESLRRFVVEPPVIKEERNNLLEIVTQFSVITSLEDILDASEDQGDDYFDEDDAENLLGFLEEAGEDMDTQDLWGFADPYDEG